MSGRVLVVGSANVDVVLPGRGAAGAGRDDPGHRLGPRVRRQGGQPGRRGSGRRRARRAARPASATTRSARRTGIGWPGWASTSLTCWPRRAGAPARPTSWSTPTARTRSWSTRAPTPRSTVADLGAGQRARPAATCCWSSASCPGRSWPRRSGARRAVGARVVLNLAPSIALPADAVGARRPDGGQRGGGPAADRLRRPAGRPGRRAGGDARLSGGHPRRAAAPAGTTSTGRPSPCRPEEVLDTTGAGDAFCGALAAALAERAGPLGRPRPRARGRRRRRTPDGRPTADLTTRPVQSDYPT